MLYKQTDFYSTVLTVFYGKCERKAQWVILFGSIQPYFVDTENRDTTDKKKKTKQTATTTKTEIKQQKTVRDVLGKIVKNLHFRKISKF